MTIDHSQPDSLSQLPGIRVFKPSHRTRPEQFVGFAIFISICLGLEFLNGKLIQTSFKSSWYNSLFQAPWSLGENIYGSLWTVYYLFLSFAVWTLWRRYSLRVLKLEISVFLSQFLFQIAWSLSFFVFQETLLALAALVLLWCNHLSAALLFWKKERLSGQLLLFPFLWIFFVMGLNMAICISNP